MGCDLFIHHECPYRPDGEIRYLQSLIRCRSYLEAMRADDDAPRSVKVRIFEPGPDGQMPDEPIERELDEGALDERASRLDEVYETCQECPANYKRAFGIKRSVGCHARVNYPLDGFSERILHEALKENGRPDRFNGEQGNLVRAIIADPRYTGEVMSKIVGSLAERGIGDGPSDIARETVSFNVDDTVHHVSVAMLEEALFFRPLMQPRAVADTLAFFRAFFAVVGRYVSDDDGRLDPEKNDRFWQQSSSLNEINLYVHALKQANRLGVGATIDG